MTRLRQFWTIGVFTAGVTSALVPPSAYGGRRDATATAPMVCAKQNNPQAIKVRPGQCRTNEAAMPVDAQTVQGVTLQQILTARAASPDPGAAGLSLVDAVGQLAGYLMMVGDGPMLVRLSNAGLVALPLQAGQAGNVYLSAVRRGLKYFYESTDCSGPPLLVNHVGGDSPVIREGIFDGARLLHAGDPMTDPLWSPHKLGSYSREKDDETGTCSHDAGDPVSVPVGDRCCFSSIPTNANGVQIDDFKPIVAVGPIVTEDFPTFVEPLHVAGF